MHISCTAVLAIRGTLSLEDLITDFLCEPAALDDWIQGAHLEMISVKYVIDMQAGWPFQAVLHCQNPHPS